MFYNKYRPRRFRQVIGQPAAAALRRGIEGGRLPTAILLAGGRGRGKTTLARLVAKGLNCSRSKDGEPCGRCRACSTEHWLEEDAGAYRGAAEINNLRTWLSSVPEYKRRVAIIDEAHALSKKAQTALLKIVEEPPRDSNVILLTTNPEKLSDALRSRCVWYPIHGIERELIAKHLRRVSKREGIRLHPNAAKLIARESGGSLRDALSHLEGVASADPNPIVEKVVRWSMRILDTESLVEAVLANDLPDALVAIEVLASVYSARAILTITAKDLMEVATKLFESDEQQAVRLSSVAAELHIQRAAKVVHELAHLQATLIVAMRPEVLGGRVTEKSQGGNVWDNFLLNLVDWCEAGIYPEKILAEALLITDVKYNPLAKTMSYKSHEPASADLRATFEEALDVSSLEWRLISVKDVTNDRRRATKSDKDTGKKRRRKRRR